jgi:predicted TIM-barrel fold metal-dependent hydrolase
MRLAVAAVIDCHVHVVDPAAFPAPPGPGYKPGPSDAGTAADLQRVLANHEIGHAVIVQLSGYGTDNACILDAVARSNGACRAIVSVGPEFTDADLDRLHAAGAVGARFNVKNLGPTALVEQSRLFDAMAERGWVAQVQLSAAELGEFAPFLEQVQAPLLFDHLGLPHIEAGIADRGFQRLLAFGRAGAYIKLSGAFRASRRGFPHPDLDPFVEALLAAFAKTQRVWGSDWPFTGLATKPAYAGTLAMLERWLPDADERRLACVDVPARLFGFAACSR